MLPYCDPDVIRPKLERRKRMSAAAKREADRWNQHYPVGTEVLVRRDAGQVTRTRTRGEAEVRGAIAVIFLDGIGGYYSLERVSPVKPNPDPFARDRP